MAKSTPSPPPPSLPIQPIVPPPTISDSSTTTLAIPIPVAIPLSKPPPPPSKSTSAKRRLPHARELLSKAKSVLPFVKAPPTFHRFNDLPTELRLKIWEATIEKRVHELHPCSQIYLGRMTFRSNSSSTPSIFHACHQSRLVALENYRLMEYTPSNTAYLAEEGGAGNGKGILRFYFAPDYDTLLLNSLMGLFVMFMLLEDNAAGMHAPPSILSTGGPTAGVMKGWKRVAIDAERAQLITLLSGINGHSPQPGFKKLLPDLKELVIAFDYTKSGKTRFRTSVWPGEDGTTLVGHVMSRKAGLASAMDECLEPLRGFLRRDYGRGRVAEEDATGSNHGAGQLDEISENADADESLISNGVTDDGSEAESDDRESRLADLEEGIPSISIARVKRKRYVRGDLRYAFRWSCSLVRVRPRGIFRRL